MLKKREKNSDLFEIKDLNNIKEKLDVAYKSKREKQIKRTERIVRIEFRILRLEWAMFIIFLWQIGILIKITVN